MKSWRRCAAGVTAFAFLALPATPPLAQTSAPSPAATAPASSHRAPVAATQQLTPAQSLGQAAGHRLQQGGGTVDEFICTAAYTADAQSGANGLPPTSARSAAQAEYLSACMSAM